MGNQIHYQIVKDEYAARVSNLHMYNAVRFVVFSFLVLFTRISTIMQDFCHYAGFLPLCRISTIMQDFCHYAGFLPLCRISAIMLCWNVVVVILHFTNEAHTVTWLHFVVYLW